MFQSMFYMAWMARVRVCSSSVTLIWSVIICCEINKSISLFSIDPTYPTTIST